VFGFVLERLAAGATGLKEMAAGSVYAATELADAFAKLVACPGFEPCIAPLVQRVVPQAARIQPSLQYNALALQRATGGAAPALVASPVLGSCLELSPAEAQLVAAACGLGDLRGDDAALAGFKSVRLPQLLALGILAAG